MSTDACIGSLDKHPTGVIADRAARYVLGHQSPRLVVIDPRGRVWIGPVGPVDPATCLGIYQGTNLVRIICDIREDLEFELFVRAYHAPRCA